MATREVVDPAVLARKPQKNCHCNGDHKPDYIYPYPYCPPYNYCPPPPPPPHCNCPPEVTINPCCNSIESQIAKLSKKAAIIRKMKEALVIKNKPILITIGGNQYNFGSYLDKEQIASTVDMTEELTNVTEYGEKIASILDAELTAIREKITELTAKLDASFDEDITGQTPTTVTQE